MLEFDVKNYSVEEFQVEGEKICCRVYRDILYVEKPIVPKYQSMNIFIPCDYYKGEFINQYNLNTAPIFMPNLVGGYWPGEADEPKENRFVPGETNSVFKALQRGYIVAAPAIRGRDQKDEQGVNVGKAPACIVDYKAAVRFVRHFDEIPGDKNKIITNGTSAGGAISSLMGSTGNHPDYEPFLKEIGAADESDQVFIASCYCPITNLDHADMAYEWQFNGIYDFKRRNVKRNADGTRSFSFEEGHMTDESIQVSKELAAMFPIYLNSLELKDENGESLTLDENGQGTFVKFLERMLVKSANKELQKGTDLTEENWVHMEDGKAVSVDFSEYVRKITRMKTAPSFDFLDMNSFENNVFGTASEEYRHFSEYSKRKSKVNGNMADEKVIRVMNPMNYIFDNQAKKASYFRIRHGEIDRDTSLAISAMLVSSLREAGNVVDYELPWGKMHSGDYDLNELFDWIDKISK